MDIKKKSLQDVVTQLEELTTSLENFTGVASEDVFADPTPQTIATIDVRLHFDAKARFLEDQHQCPLCGTELLLTYVTHFVNQSVQEEAHCEKCKIRVRQNEHSLQ